MTKTQDLLIQVITKRPTTIKTLTAKTGKCAERSTRMAIHDWLNRGLVTMVKDTPPRTYFMTDEQKKCALDDDRITEKAKVCTKKDEMIALFLGLVIN